MKNGMIYDGGKLFPCDAIQSRISDQATVTAVTNLLAEDPDIVNAPTEEQEKKEKEAEKEAEENQTDKKEKLACKLNS